MFHYYYNNKYPKAHLSKWQVISETSCRLIGQPTVTWDNLGSLFFKHNYYERLIDCLLDPDQNLYKIIQFCENNPNSVEIEIDRRIEPNSSYTFYSGHHIFASCRADLTELISENSAIPSVDRKIKVKWIHNYGAEQETTLDEFLKTVGELQTDREKCGIVYKCQCSPPDTFEELKHLSFLLDLRRFCGDVKEFDLNGYHLDTVQQFQECFNNFHKKYVQANILPDRKIVWKFLTTVVDCDRFWHIDKNLDWSNVKSWTNRSNVPSKSMANDPQKIVNVPPTITPTQKPVAAPHITLQIYEKNVSILIEKMTSSTCHPKTIFSIYESLFKNKIVDSLKNPDLNSNSTKICFFLFESVKKHSIIGCFSVPQPAGSSKKLLLVVNNVRKKTSTESTARSDLMAYVKNTSKSEPFFVSNFKIMFDNQPQTPEPVNVGDASRILSKILANVEPERIDGQIVEEQSF